MLTKSKQEQKPPQKRGLSSKRYTRISVRITWFNSEHACVSDISQTHEFALANACLHVCMSVPCPRRRLIACVITAWFTVSQLRRNDWTSWAETTAVKAVLSCDIHPNTLTKSHLTGPSYRKWKRKPLVHPVHLSFCSLLHVKPLSQTVISADFNCCKTTIKELAWAGNLLLLGVKCLVSWHLATED